MAKKKKYTKKKKIDQSGFEAELRKRGRHFPDTYPMIGYVSDHDPRAIKYFQDIVDREGVDRSFEGWSVHMILELTLSEGEESPMRYGHCRVTFRDIGDRLKLWAAKAKLKPGRKLGGKAKKKAGRPVGVQKYSDADEARWEEICLAYQRAKDHIGAGYTRRKFCEEGGYDLKEFTQAQERLRKRESKARMRRN